MENKTTIHTKRERAKQFVREVLASEFGQNVDEDTVNIVADKVLKSLPTDKDGRQDNPKRSGAEPSHNGTGLQPPTSSGIKPGHPE
jgi:hypothetical protein